MDFKLFFQSLSSDQQKEFAEIAGAKLSYIRTHLIYRRKIPQPALMDGLVLALHKFNSNIDRQELLNFFYPPTDQAEIDRRATDSLKKPINKHNRTRVRRAADREDRRNRALDK